MRVFSPAHLCSLAFLLLFAAEVPAQAAACRTKAKISTTTDLQFGSVAVVGTGTLTVSPNSFLTSSGGAVSIPSSTISAAHFEITGCPDAVYAVVLPAPISMKSKNVTMTVDNFTSQPNGSGMLNAAGTGNISVGATLNTAPNQTPGAYTGRFTIELIF